MNKAEAMKLFEEKACLVGERDVIPKREAKKITGSKAIDFAGGQKIGCVSLYGIGDYQMSYLTKEGFFLAVTYMNVANEREMEKLTNQ